MLLRCCGIDSDGLMVVIVALAKMLVLRAQKDEDVGVMTVMMLVSMLWKYRQMGKREGSEAKKKTKKKRGKGTSRGEVQMKVGMVMVVLRGKNGGGRTDER